MMSATREPNQINLKSLLNVEQQQLCNCNNKYDDNNSKTNFNHKKKENPIKQTENEIGKYESSNSSNNGKNNNNKCNKIYNDKHNNIRKSQIYNKNNNGNNSNKSISSNNNERNQKLITDRPEALSSQITTKIMATKASDMKATILKVKAEKMTTTTINKIPTLEMTTGAKLTLRKSLSTPASFKINNVAKESKSSWVGENNYCSHNEITDKKELIISENKIAAEKAYWRDNKDENDGGGGGVRDGEASIGDGDSEEYDTTDTDDGSSEHRKKCTKPASPADLETTLIESLDALSQPHTIPQQQCLQQKQLKAKSVGVIKTPVPSSDVNFNAGLRFGCSHYKRRAMFVTPCCNKFYKCRFCHDENESHHFDRKTLTELICSECNTRQKVQELCEACGVRFGKYTCLICNLFDDTDKKQYHCNGCGICRIGGAENFFHCKVCDMCLPIRLKIDGHRCVENISRSHCPVCLGDIHTSRIPCHIPDCGHLLHKTCFDQLLNSGHYTCPICQTSLIDMTALWEYLDAQAVSLPVPKKYENEQIHIFCNDCHKTSKTKFNFIGLKCMQCGAYNTTHDVKRRISLVADEPSSA